MNKVLLVVLVILAGLQYRLWWGEGGLTANWQLQQAIAEQQALNERLAQRNRLLEAEVADLKQGMAAIEERARSELGMVRQDETYFLLVEPSPPHD
ncbi:cell division protein FtsB [Balneatrix alpica]|uniref:Cell division protein FtsB n=1 Tax=Balneatrix alpica TaxID=75684 RepID=A0ABV5ZCK4_9GAMM|nr:cell division protein FtsB [Balneatrix alpica]